MNIKELKEKNEYSQKFLTYLLQKKKAKMTEEEKNCMI